MNREFGQKVSRHNPSSEAGFRVFPSKIGDETIKKTNCEPLLTKKVCFVIAISKLTEGFLVNKLEVFKPHIAGAPFSFSSFRY